MDIDKKLFSNLSLADLLSEIHTNSRIKNRTIESKIIELSKKAKTVNELVIIAPIVKEYYDLAIKNDQHLIKLTELVHKYMVADSKATGASGPDDMPEWNLSDDEKQQLIHEMDQALGEAKETLSRPLPGNDSKGE